MKFFEPNLEKISLLQYLYVLFLKKFHHLGYRKKVCGVIIDSKGNFLVDQLVGYGQNQWNFPGGGIDQGETAKEALLRELYEELGSRDFKIIRESKIISRYEWPNSVIIKRLKEKKELFRGQSASHFLVKYLGDKEKLQPDPGEIRKIKWIKRGEFEKYFVFPGQFEETIKIFKDLKI